MASKRTPYELAEEILGLTQTLVLELGGSDAAPGAQGEKPVQLDLAAAAAGEGAGTSDQAQEEEETRLVGASWAPRSWS